ncbi:sugar phosphate isomerase/epimerase [Kineosporia mesophila]|uniref:Sugar phosphate isomerase/epimerase n=1 Tax=Kineosporia mesophila TaxID=566012 RepID=A0ABP7A4H3_9ACTN|nr:sugar phosphate isomerase/epimerase [Kineosporia mesophila]MCD5353831.1 sugar phosphate isomerase/epimerase [Kineosporia mesophila]
MTETPSPWATRRRAPVRSTPQELHLSAMTLRYCSFSDRVLAAAAAGFSGIGLGAVDYLDARRSEFSEEQLADYVSRHGLRVVELEFLADWWREADVRGVRLEEDLLFYLADLLEVPQINVGLFAEVPMDVQKQQFRRLCTRAADHGVRIALEFMPYSSLRTLDAARELVSCADTGNAGLMLDAWHWHRSGGTPDELRALSASEVFAVQLCDASAVPNPDLRHEGRHERLLPGEGVVDLNGFLGALTGIGVDLPLAVEVLSDQLDARHPVEVARLAAQSVTPLLAERAAVA